MAQALGRTAWQALQGPLAVAPTHASVRCEQTLPNSTLRKIEIELRAHFDAAGTILDANAALQRLTGYPVADLVGRHGQDLVAQRFQRRASDCVRCGGEYLYEAAIVHRDGHEIPVEIVGKTVPEHDDSYRIVVLRDISKRQKVQQREAFRSLHDSLTQLPNQRYFMDFLDNLLAQAQQERTQVAVLFLDLDHFKTINDSLGHPAGDQLLCKVTRRLRATVRGDGVVATQTERWLRTRQARDAAP